MKHIKKIMALGVSAFAIAGIACLSPANAAAPKATTLDVGSQQNSAVDVRTELNCNYHMLTATVTNKTDNKVTPRVTFNMQPSPYDTNTPIDPGQSREYTYNFSNNNISADVAVNVDGYDPVKLSPMLSCSEPVSFTVTDTSSSAVTGMLRNNSSLVSQTVLTRVGSGDVHVENLAPGEARLIALPFTGYPDQQIASVAIGTTSGYQSMYSVDLTQNSGVIPLK